MIEAANSVIANAPLLRQGAEAANSARPVTSGGGGVQAAPRAPFISPVVSVDLDYDTAVLQIRNSRTGEVVRQMPTEAQLEANSKLEQQQEHEELLEIVYGNGAEDAKARAQTGRAVGGIDLGGIDIPSLQQQAASPAPSTSADTARASAALQKTAGGGVSTAGTSPGSAASGGGGATGGVSVLA